MHELLDKKVLFIGPKTFNYETIIKQELERLGAMVDYFDDRPSNNFLTKVFIRLNLKFLINKKINSYYQTIYQFISDKVYDYVFVVSPETLTAQELEIIRTKQPNAKFILYMWDSFSNKNSSGTIKFFDKVFSFDSKDVSEYKLNFLPLFYMNEYRQLKSDQFDYDLSFVATAHSDRYKVAKQIFSQLNGYRVFGYFFIQSKIMYYVRKTFLKKYQYGKIDDFSFKPLAHSTIIDIFQKSKAVLDIHHPNQLGLTMRTFECLGAQKKLITTNKSVRDYDFFNENNILIIDRDNVYVNENFFKTSYIELSSELYEKYSITQWLTTIFKNDGLNN